MALAARLLGIAAVIVMPHDAPAGKLAATEGYGAEIVSYDRYSQDPGRAGREARAASAGSAFVPPYDHPMIMAGRGPRRPS